MSGFSELRVIGYKAQSIREFTPCAVAHMKHKSISLLRYLAKSRPTGGSKTVPAQKPVATFAVLVGNVFDRGAHSYRPVWYRRVLCPYGQACGEGGRRPGSHHREMRRNQAAARPHVNNGLEFANIPAVLRWTVVVGRCVRVVRPVDDRAQKHLPLLLRLQQITTDCVVAEREVEAARDR